MSNPTPQLVQKLWNYCNILRDNALSYGDYVEHLTHLLFLGMADEQAKSPYLTEEKRRDAAATIPKGKDWPALLAKDGDELEFTTAIRWRHSANGRACSASFSARRRTRSRTRPCCVGLSCPIPLSGNLLDGTGRKTQFNMMVKTISKIGNSHGLMFDAALMDLAHLKAGDQVNVEVHEGGTITLTPLHPKPSRAEVSRVIDATMKDYARTMKKLA